jgi:hypothetical protein
MLRVAVVKAPKTFHAVDTRRLSGDEKQK